jgi:hypothetical protein
MNFGDRPTTTTGSSMGSYPSWMREDMLEAQDAYKKLYESNLDRGYRPYTGMTTAGFTPEQIASQQGLASLVGSQAPLQQEALGLTRGLSSEFTPDQAQKYMSPYLRASLDAQKAAAQRQFEGTKLPEFEAQAVRAGGMSGLGSRAGVQAAELQAGQNRLMADLEATGQQKAYEDAQNLFKSQKEREKQSALALQNLNKEMFSGSLKEQALLDAIGTEKQQMAQTMLDEAQTKYYDKEEFARNELNKWYQSLLGNPIWKQPNYQTTGSQAGGGPGLGKTLMSLAGIGLGLGNFKFPFMKGGGSIGGGLASTSQARPYMNYMRRNMGGQVMPPVVYRQVGGGELLDEDAAFQTGANRPVSDIVAAREAVEAAGMARGVDTLASDSDGPAVAPPSILTKADIAAPETALPTRITSPYETLENVALGNIKQIARDKVAEATANRAASEKEIKGIRRETEAFQKTQQDRFNKYQDMVKKLVGEDPNANRKFWFTVAAAIAQPGGNAATNFVKGMNKATLDADANRKEKNKMFMRLAKDEMEFMKDVDKLGFKSEIKLLGLTKAQEKELAGMDSNIRKEFLAELKAGAEYNTAKAKLLKAKAGKRDKAAVYNAIRKAVKENRNWVFDEEKGTIKVNGKPLRANSPEFKEVEIRISKALKAYKEGGGDMLAAQNIIKQLTGQSLSRPQSNSNTDPANIPSRPIPQAAINDLINNPSLARAFDEEYGDGKAAAILGDE